MKSFVKIHWLALVISALLTGFYFWGLRLIPFHPDEATYLFMSSDFETLFSDPLSLAWQPDHEDDPRQRYRMIDAPLTRYILALGRIAVGREALPVDWDWAQSWDENQIAGALPDERLLLAGRSAMTLLLPFSLFFTYWIGQKIGNRTTGWLALILLGLNAFIIFHARRAMGEGVLLFGLTFTLATLFQAHKRPWLTGLAMGLAFCAKQSSIGLLPIALLAVIWLPKGERRNFRRMTLNLVQFSLVFLAIFMILNPVFWNQPWRSLPAALAERQTLIEEQIVTCLEVNPDCDISTPIRRVAALIRHVYVAPPAHPQILNLEPTFETARIYNATFGHNLFRGLIWGVIFLVLTLLGLGIAGRDLLQARSETHKNIWLIFAATISQAFVIVILIPFPWDRYYLPLVPFSAVWIAYGLTRTLPITRILPKKSARIQLMRALIFSLSIRATCAGWPGAVTG